MPRLPPMPPPRFPYSEAGLSAEEAAAHLLGRFTFGPTPGEVGRVAEEGLEAWFERQLRADAPDPEWERMTRADPTLARPTEVVVTRLVTVKELRKRAFAAGATATLKPERATRVVWRKQFNAYKEAEGLVLAPELLADARRARIVRAIVGRNQLHEVLSAFWANHLYVGQGPAANPFLGAYDREAVRPHALGPFGRLLLASARHPAMLLYLDNAVSSAPRGTPTAARGLGRIGGRSKGLNENYARELLELHTLGADGPYTQDDVGAVARVFSGWGLVPFKHRREGPAAWEALLDAAGPQRDRFLLDGLFLFRADLHDASPKTVLGEHLPAGGGVEEGERLLDRLALHPSTARHLATTLARRFAADTPPDVLVDTLADAYLASGGDTQAVLRALAASPMFWSEGVVRAKVKTPFELVVGAVRATGAQVEFKNGLQAHLAALGEAPFGHIAPDGYPDHASAWINAGTLLGRMRFGVDLASGEVDGVALDPDRLVAEAGYDPRDPADALEACVDLLLAGRDREGTRELLRPVVEQAAYADRVVAAAPPPAAPPPGEDDEPFEEPVRRRRQRPTSPAQQALSVVLGSPEFQRQ